MTQYAVGVKIVQFWPEKAIKQMGVYPPGSDGYAVRYDDGYTSWSPKEVFEKSYLPMGEANNNTVTKEMVDVFIGHEYQATQLDEKTTLLSAETVTGFRQYETSSCVDPANFDMEIGAEICLDRIKNTIWKCLGFVIQWGRYGLKR